MKRLTFLVITLSLLLTGVAAHAMPVQMTSGAIVLPASTVSDGAEAQLTLEKFNLVARNADGSYLIHDGEALYNVAAELMAKAIDIPDGVAAFGTLETLAKGEKGDHVLPLQQGLKTLGYLSGSADGDFGSGTERAVIAFQEAMGLEATGEADELTQLLVLSLSAEPVDMEGRVDPELLFAPILRKTDADLTAILESGLMFDYDDISGEGFITDGRVTRVDASGKAELDKYEVSVCFGLLTQETDEGVTIQPAMKVECLCVRRPMMAGVTLKAGDRRGENAVQSLSVRLEGIYTVEKGIVILTDEMADALAGAADAGELKLRIEGQYQTFDIAMEDPASAARIGQVAQAIRQ